MQKFDDKVRKIKTNFDYSPPKIELEVKKQIYIDTPQSNEELSDQVNLSQMFQSISNSLDGNVNDKYDSPKIDLTSDALKKKSNDQINEEIFETMLKIKRGEVENSEKESMKTMIQEIINGLEKTKLEDTTPATSATPATSDPLVNNLTLTEEIDELRNEIKKTKK